MATRPEVATPPPPADPASPIEYLPVGIRAWATRPAGTGKDQAANNEAASKPVGGLKRRLPHEALIFDTETRDEPGQRLLFGVWRLYVDNLDSDPATFLVEEGIFYPDDLPDTDPAWWAILRSYVEEHEAAEVAPGNSPRLLLWLVSRWLDERLRVYGYKHRDRCNVVGFNLPFDLGGLAVHFGPARPATGGGMDYYPGWSLSFDGMAKEGGGWRDRRWFPRLFMKSIDPRRTLMGWANIHETEPGEVAKGQGGGRFVDLRTLAFALTDQSLTLEGACGEFGFDYDKADVEYGTITERILDYGREDVAATAELYRRCLAELAKHEGVDLPPHRLFSPATVGASYLHAMGVDPPLTRHRGQLSDEFLGDCMSAFYGGRAEARIIRVSLPVVVADFTSMYPAQNALLGTWEILTADTLQLDDVTEQVAAMVADPDLFTRLHRQETWRDDIGVTFVRLADIDGAVLPVRARYEPAREEDDGGRLGRPVTGNLNIGVNPLDYHGGTLTYALSDVLAAALLGPAAFRVVQATRVRPVGQQSGLRPVLLRGRRRLDPTARDPFLSMIEERHRVKKDDTLETTERDRVELFLKITANAASYGSLARFDRHDRPAKNPVKVNAHGPGGVAVEASITGPEEPGPYCFPPVAASITAGARLMLALMETHITRAGGSYAFMDTDSAAIVATPDGGPVPCPGEPDDTLTALSFDQVRGILAAFNQLNPYGDDVVNDDPRITRAPWKAEKNSMGDPLKALVISAKRYLLYRGDPASPQLMQAMDRDDTDPTDDDGAGSPEVLDIADWSEHGIGLYRDPLPKDQSRDAKARRIWTRHAWTYLLRVSLGLDAALPSWSAKPALTQFTISSPRQRRWFNAPESDTPHAERPRPAGFGLLGQVAPGTALGSAVPAPAAPYTRDSDEWSKLPWTDRHTGQPLSLVTADPDESPELYSEQLTQGRIELRTLGEVINRYRERPEHKSRDSEDQPTTGTTIGKLTRRPVHARPTDTLLIGKESNKLAERETGASEVRDARTAYGSAGDEWEEWIRPALRRAGPAVTAAALGMTARRARDLLAGRARPHDGSSGHYSAARRLALAVLSGQGQFDRSDL